jgi:hypothetical protein
MKNKVLIISRVFIDNIFLFDLIKMSTFDLFFMKATISFSTEFPNHTTYNNPHELTFLEGDFYNIYHHTVSDKSLENHPVLYKFFAFQVVEITPQTVRVKTLFGKIQTHTITKADNGMFNFENLGNLKIQIKNIN